MKKVHDSGDSLIVFKDNKPYTIIMSLNEYESLIEIKENYELLNLAVKRTKSATDADYLSDEEVYLRYGFSKKEFEESSESVDIE